MNDQQVIILGASARAAATSARRAGWTPWCVDLFADADLERIATVRQAPLDAYPHGLFDALAEAPHVPVIYTGALENWPGLIENIARPLWGNPPDVLRTIRDPYRWTQYLNDHEIPCPRIACALPADGEWLLKPRKSAGGIGVRAYAGQRFKPRTHYLQQRIDGDACSAVFLGAELVGVCRQLIGVPWLNAIGYQYCGNVGPLPLERAAGLVPADPSAGTSPAACWRQFGVALTDGFGLRGLFGIDAIVQDGVPWPVEINPRYTASLELFERSYRYALLTRHRAIFEEAPLPIFPRLDPSIIWGKAILYARQSFAFPADGPWLASLEDGVDLDNTEYADIPHAGAIIERGQPVLTMFASAATVSECETMLQEKAQALDRRLWG